MLLHGLNRRNDCRYCILYIVIEFIVTCWLDVQISEELAIWIMLLAAGIVFLSSICTHYGFWWSDKEGECVIDSQSLLSQYIVPSVNVCLVGKWLALSAQ